MKLLETKEQLTLNELLRIAYEYGNDNADMPTDSESVEQEFSEWIESSKHLFKKLIIPRVSGSFSCDIDKACKDPSRFPDCGSCVFNGLGAYVVLDYVGKHQTIGTQPECCAERISDLLVRRPAHFCVDR